MAKQCKCKNQEFYAHQVCYHDIAVDSDGNFKKNIGSPESDPPYGPYICTKCGEEYEELTDLPEK